MIQTSSLESLKSQIDIVDIVSNYIELKKAGANLKANCPFHDEKSGSFVVSPKKQICHCFGCGYSSDAIGFVQNYKKLSFVEAVESIANDMNYTLVYENVANKKDYSKVMEFTNKFYLANMDQEIHSYLLERGLTNESIKAFEIGFAPASKQQVTALNKELLNVNEAIECGVLALDDSKQVYARLTNRISFPIRNHTGKLIGFGGRIIKGDRAKYINSPKTPLFEKSRNLYGYNLAKEHIYRMGTFVVTEGYLDVIMLHQAGIQTAVATMGTALTELHCNIIKKANAKVLLCFDRDKAGVEAAFKASKLLSAHEIHGGVVLFPEGKDPADMVKSGNIEELRTLMGDKTPLVEFVLQHIASKYSLSVPQQKQEALNEIKQFLRTLSSLLQDEYKSFVAQLLNISQTHIEVEHSHTPQETQRVVFTNISEMNIINSANESDTLFSIAVEHLTPEMFDFHRAEYEMLLHKDARLQGILLADGLSVYEESEMHKQVKIMCMSYHKKQLQVIASTQEFDYERKSFEIKKLRGIIHSLKKEIA